MLKQALACVQPHQSLHCSHTCAKWAYIRHILSVNAQTSLSVCAVLSEPSLLSHMHKMGVHMAIFFSQCSDETLYACSLARAFTALVHTQNGCVFGIFYQSMFRQTLACVQSRQTLPCSHTCTERAYIRYISSVNAQTHMSICAVSLEPSLLSHMHKMGVHTAYS